ncbi:MAG: class II fructose-bisphosphate aldolase [Christensenella sp.]
MIDGSKLAFEENIRLSSRVAELCAPCNIPVEAELGKAGAKNPGLYDPKEFGKVGRARVKQLVMQRMIVCGSAGKADAARRRAAGGGSAARWRQNRGVAGHSAQSRRRVGRNCRECGRRKRDCHSGSNCAGKSRLAGGRGDCRRTDQHRRNHRGNSRSNFISVLESARHISETAREERVICPVPRNSSPTRMHGNDNPEAPLIHIEI